MIKPIIALSVGLACLAMPGFSQQPCPTQTVPCCPQQNTPQTSGKWNYSITPYIWFSGINGDIAVRGITASIDESFSDLASNLDFGFQFHFEAEKDNWGYFVDPTYIKLSADETTAAGPVSADFKEWMVEFAGTHQFPLRPRGPNQLPQTFGILFGGRFWNLDGNLSVGGTSVSGSQTWVDPIIGFRYRTDLSKKWATQLRFDVGGFGVGSDFTWNVVALAGYRTSKYATLLVGYRALGVDRESGSGADFFKWDVTYSGPELGFRYEF